MSKKVGFVGLGVMGVPMVNRLHAAGADLAVWARSPQKRNLFQNRDILVAETVEGLFSACDTVILMLANEGALDEVLGRGCQKFEDLCRDHTLIQMGTTLPGYSKILETDVVGAGGRYVEMPVSGSSVPAATGELVAMQAGDPQTLKAVRSIVSPLAKVFVDCGPVPRGIQMKLAVNASLPGLVYGLVEATNFAKKCGLDIASFQRVLESSQMSSPVLKLKLPKLIEEDFSPQTTGYQALKNMEMMKAAGDEVGAPMPVLEAAHKMQKRAMAMGLSDLDMIASIRAYKNPDE